MKFLPIAFLILSNLIFAAQPNSEQNSLESSPIIRTMSREIKRSMENLHLKGSPRPYFLSYLFWDVQSYQMQASMGSCEISSEEREHYLEVDLRVGDYRQDNSNFQGALVFGPSLRSPLPQENDTTLLALSLWAATDARYKVAIEQLAQKKAFLTNHSVKETLPDFSKQKVLQKLHLDSATTPDTAKIKNLGKALSQYLGEKSWLQESRIGFQYYFTTFYYVDAEGARYIQSQQEHTLLVSLFTQAEDGAPLWNYFRVSTRNPMTIGDGALSLSALKDSLDPILQRLQALRTQKPINNYRGPVLFSGMAAGEVLHKSLLSPQRRLRESLGANSEPNFMVNMAGRKLFPSEVTVIETPSLEQFQGRTLYGHYLLDHQGQPAQDLILINQGKMQDYFLGKVPVFRSKGHTSNGHWRYGGGFPGVTALKSNKGVNDEELYSSLKLMGQEEGIGYGLVISKMLDEDAFKLLRHPLASQLLSSDGLDGNGTFSLGVPCEIDRLDSKTGIRSPVRGLSFPPIDSKSLRNIVAIGVTPYLHEPQASFSILCPPLLFNLLDLKGSRRTQPHLPLIP